MPRELAMYRWDIVRAEEDIERYMAGKDLAVYKADHLLQAPVERKSSIIGEALNQALQHYPGLHGKIDQDRNVVSFRHGMTHGYFSINHDLVRSVTKVGLPQLISEARSIIEAQEI